MFKNYVKVALRNLWKNKAFSAINIIGLAAGLAVCLLIVLYVVDELSYDKYNKNAARIYRLDADIYFNNTQAIFAVAPDPLAPALKRDFPDIEEITRVNYQNDVLVKKDNQNVKDHHAAFADSTFFKVFTVQMLQGNPATALTEPNSIVIDETTARKYFNSTNVVGKTLYIDNSTNCKITGVIKDIPRQSHFHFSFIRPRGKDNDSWLSNNTYNYVLVKPGVTKQKLQSEVNATINNYLGKELQEQLHASLTDMEKKGNHFIYHATPLTDIHLHSDKQYEIEANGNITYVYIFSVIAIFILLIACVNFMNLSTARSANRAKEVGIRKVAGSLRSHLIIQFLTESVLLSFFSMLIAIAIAASLLPLFNQLANKEMHVSTLFSTWLFPVMIVLVFVVGCIAGSYPAFYLSSFQPIQVLKGKIAKGFKSSWLRSGLVVFQFSISIILIIGTIVIYNQLDYIRSRKIGYNRDQVLVLHNAWYLDKQIHSFRNELLNLPGVTNATISGDLPTGINFDNEGWFRDATFDASRVVVLTNFYVDENYIPTLGMQMAQGRNFSKDFPSDSTGVILNEAAVKVLGFKDPFKEILYRPDFSNGNINGAIAYHVVGVVKDFNFSSMHSNVGPLIIQLSENWGSIAVRINSKNIPSLINSIQAKWNSMAPGQPFNYTFMDADFNNIYTAEQQTGKLFITFAVFAIFIGCLGLFGLVTYAAEQRTKEIGVRKVLGASVSGIVAMLSKDFAKLVLIASLIAFPVAWWAMNKWLQSFAYRINISWWVFVVAGIAAIAIALITVSFQAIKAAVANPVKSLRTE
ncbi:FtsX-like permease family protein [Ilyomonas limi]|uniref:FtsX-like permease family protein n=1 Tax=Ilyomonas limi TaxID=2575867 RepID=A0A4U3KZP1_9BACT|nr:ABC transporter permease [Ilyomonas limi]TKK68271.1 FtsX-like permease family protein [Ilyomonas limi]